MISAIQFVIINVNATKTYILDMFREYYILRKNMYKICMGNILDLPYYEDVNVMLE